MLILVSQSSYLVLLMKYAKQYVNSKYNQTYKNSLKPLLFLQILMI